MLPRVCNLGEYTKGTKAKTFIWDATGKLIPLSTDVYDIAKTDAE